MNETGIKLRWSSQTWVQAIFAQTTAFLSRAVSVSSVILLQRRFSMPRRGWKSMRVGAVRVDQLQGTSEASGGRARSILMPSLVLAELDNWMQDLQVELQSAMNLGDQRRVVEVSTKLAEGASQMVYLTGGMA